MRLAWWRWLAPMRIHHLGVDVPAIASFLGMPIISLAPASRIYIGERSVLCSDSAYTALGINHAVVLRTLRPMAIIEIGADVGMSGASICAAMHISIGSGCLIGANVTIVDTDFHAIQSENRRYNKRFEDITTKPVQIGSNVFLGAGAIVLKGVTIGDNVVIGAGSVVTNDIPSNFIAAGNPARPLKSLI
jgi:hypothetical protein